MKTGYKIGSVIRQGAPLNYTWNHSPLDPLVEVHDHWGGASRGPRAHVVGE